MTRREASLILELPYVESNLGVLITTLTRNLFTVSAN